MVKSYKYFARERQRTMMKLNLENQLRKIITNDMEIKVIKINKDYTYDKAVYPQTLNRPPKLSRDPTAYNDSGEYVRNAYLVYIHQYIYDKERIDMTNRKLYIEATFNSVCDVSYEIWLLRTYILLIP
jgi:hypothetical protein